MVMLRIKSKGIAHAAIWYMVANILPVESPHPNPRGMLKKRSKFNFTENSQDKYQIKGKGA